MTEPTTDRGETADGLNDYAADLLEDGAAALRNGDQSGALSFMEDALEAVGDANELRYEKIRQDMFEEREDDE